MKIFIVLSLLVLQLKGQTQDLIQNDLYINLINENINSGELNYICSGASFKLTLEYLKLSLLNCTNPTLSYYFSNGTLYNINQLSSSSSVAWSLDLVKQGILISGYQTWNFVSNSTNFYSYMSSSTQTFINVARNKGVLYPIYCVGCSGIGMIVNNTFYTSNSNFNYIVVKSFGLIKSYKY